MTHRLRTLVSLSLLFSIVFSNLPTLIARAANSGPLPVGRNGAPSYFPLYAANLHSIDGHHYAVSLDSGGSQTVLTSDGSLSLPFSAAVDSHGFLYVGDLFNDIIKVSPAGVQSGFVGLSGGGIPYGMAFDGSGNLFVTDGESIEKVTPAGEQSEFASGGYLSMPVGLAFDSSGYLYVANYASATNSVIKISPTGEQSVFTEGGNITNAWALAFDASDSLYVTEFTEPSLVSSIIKVSPAGSQSVFATGGELSAPRGLAFDRNGDLYAGNYAGTAIVKMGTAGSQTLFASGGDLYGPIGLAFSKGSLAAALGMSPNPSAFGQSIIITAVLTGSSGIPSGTLAFKDGGTTISGCEAVALNGSGEASCTTAALSVGTHRITTAYSGDDNYRRSTSAPYSQVVIQATATRLTSAPNPSVYGQSVTFTATVTATSDVPGGTVTFYDNAVSLGSRTLNAGVATFTTSSLSTGTHSAFTASFEGDANHAASNSSAISHTVDRAGVTISLASSPRPSTLGQMVTFTTTVAAEAPGAGAPTGVITLSIDAFSLVVPLDGSSRAVYMTSTLPTGNHPVAAAYPGDTNFEVNSGALSGGQTVLDVPVTGLSALNDSPTAIGHTTSFTATVVTGSHVQYAWAFGDGQTGAGEQVSHRYGLVGTYTATITATNTIGSLSVTTPITIGPVKLFLPLLLRQQMH